MLKIRNMVFVLFIIQLCSCAAVIPMSQVPYSEPPLPPEGKGLVYIYNNETSNKLQMHHS